MISLRTTALLLEAQNTLAILGELVKFRNPPDAFWCDQPEFGSDPKGLRDAPEMGANADDHERLFATCFQRGWGSGRLARSGRELVDLLFWHDGR
ncbi:MAG: hypothetical protein IJ935_13345 [Afipia sp.]|nr:hypothetical protein [Afipia sp.]